MKKKRRRFKQTTSLRQRLMQFIDDMRKQAECLPAGKEKEDLLNRISRADTAADIDEWVSSPGQQYPGL
jgi:hypothetical protein